MKRAVLVLMGLVLIFTYGCCSRNYVKEQVVPVQERLTKHEAEARTMAGEIAACRKDCADAKAMAAQAQRSAAQASQMAAGASDRAETAAKRAEDAAAKAEAAAAKAEKAFELKQRK